MNKAIWVVLLFLFGRVAFAEGNPAGIDTTITTNIGGIQQVLKIKGKNSAKPLLLYLHGAGGSGFSVIANADKLTSQLQEHFVVVLWDQREYGKTFLLNKSPSPRRTTVCSANFYEGPCLVLVRHTGRTDPRGLSFYLFRNLLMNDQ